MRPEAIFEQHRARLARLAYRMTGSLAEAEDAVQDAWLRWSRADREGIADPAAWLARVTARLCLDRLREAKARRETYIGPWLPEPLVEDLAEDPVERAEEVSVAFLLALQRLSPLERAVFLLRDVFDQDYGAIAETLGRGEAACRQLASRAREHLKGARPRFQVSREDAGRLVAAFMDAAARGDATPLARLLAEDCVLVTDGGGRRGAALRPFVGRADVLQFIKAFSWRHGWPPPGEARPARINGWPGLVLESPDGVQTLAFEPGEDGKLAAIYIVRNPEKLARVASR
ncbi:MAG: RNA polymerase sigma factor SigJ [Caulobacteraceae bacterium]|nr:RNA polymerase sigma factor SigJ [Caulobacteraceae bacterium]